jgi:2-polyprenyl-3-methyl-5-hydroxy-6-metoxy-1,4-benzoquinol methylase
MSDDHVATTIASYNAFAEEYTQKHAGHAPVKERDMFLAKLPAQAKILDAGCGPGRDSEYFATKGYEVTGIDLSSRFIEIAKKAAPTATFTLMDLRKITFPEQSFDGIWACQSLLHLERTEVPAVLAVFNRILKPGGIVFILVLEGEGKKLVRSGMFGKKRRFFTFFQSKTIRTFVTEAGFTIEEMYTWNQHDRCPARSSQNWISCFARKIL